MGYYTHYDLTTVQGNLSPEQMEQVKQFLSWSAWLVSEGDAGFPLSTVLEERHKWYEHDEDMLALSREYPGVTFCLSGEGEDQGDVWKKYYRDGKMQECRQQMTMPEFDPEALADPNQEKE